MTNSSIPLPESTSRARGRIARVFGTLHRWAETGWGSSATFSWGVLQGSVVPGPSEALLAPLGLADPRKAIRLSLLAALGSTLGGSIAWLIGAGFLQVAYDLLALAGVSAADLAAHRARFDRWGWWLIFASTMSPLSTKAVCIAAGAFGFPFASFISALALGRGIRFVTVGILLRWFGARVAAWLGDARRVRSSG